MQNIHHVEGLLHGVSNCSELLDVWMNCSGMKFTHVLDAELATEHACLVDPRDSAASTEAVETDRIGGLQVGPDLHHLGQKNESRAFRRPVGHP